MGGGGIIMAIRALEALTINIGGHPGLGVYHLVHLPESGAGNFSVNIFPVHFYRYYPDMGHSGSVVTVWSLWGRKYRCGADLVLVEHLAPAREVVGGSVYEYMGWK